MVQAPEQEHASVVCVGAFAPSVFQPAWFASQQLISEDDLNEADVQIISKDLCGWSTSWFRLEAVDTRISLTSLATGIFETIRDLALGTFSAVSQFPVEKVGLNSTFHFRMPSPEAYVQFGHDLAPKEEFWNSLLSDPRTASLTVTSARPDKYQGHVQVRVEPSANITHGIFVEINDEYRIPVEQQVTSAEWLVELLANDWEAHRERVRNIQNGLINRAWES